MFNNNLNISCKIAWAEDLGYQIDDKKWKQIFLNAKKITSSNKTHETQYKIIHRLHVTPAIRSKYDPTCSAQCLKCKNTVGTYSHMIWSCPKIITFWLKVRKELKKVFDLNIYLNPMNIILGIVSNYEVRYRYIIRIAQYAARLSILQKWLDEDPPDIKLWYEKLMSILPMERLSYVLRGTLADFVNDWSPIARYLKEEWKKVICMGTMNT